MPPARVAAELAGPRPAGLDPGIRRPYRSGRRGPRRSPTATSAPAWTTSRHGRAGFSDPTFAALVMYEPMVAGCAAPLNPDLLAHIADRSSSRPMARPEPIRSA
jgi:hypothetical protein